MWNWREILFGTKQPTPTPEAEAVSPSGGNGAGEDVYAHAPESELRSSEQHAFLFDDGVLHWNQHRHAKSFKPNFAGLNFVREAAKTRLFGRPADLAGDERVMLAGVDWSHADLQGCILTKADLRHAKLIGADLRKANLTGALLMNADLTDCDLRGAVLDGAQFARARLVNANLAGATCAAANFAWADLTNAALGARNLAEANLFGAVRDGAYFERHEPPKSAWTPYPAQKQLARPAGEVRI